MLRISRNGIKWEVYFPDWFKRTVMKWKGLCARPHSEFKGLYCVKEPNHDGWCGCA